MRPAPPALPSPSRPARRPVALVWVSFWLALALVAAKAVSLGPPHSWNWPIRLTLVSFRDVLFALSIAALGEGFAWICSRRPWMERSIRATATGVAALCALYGVIAYGVFESFGRHLSFDLLMLMRNAAAAKSSVTDRLTWQIALALVLAPGGLLAAARWGSRRRAFPPVVLTAMGVWIVAGVTYHTAADVDRKTQRLAACPAVEMLRSAFTHLAGGRLSVLPASFPPGYLEEFELYGKRAEAGPRTFYTPPAETPRPRNVIVIVMESVGTKYLSLYGNRWDTTPHLVEEAKHALVYDNISAHAPYTSCSFMAVNFSMHPGVPWCYAPSDSFEPNGPRELPPTLASVLQPQGWRTAFLHNGDLDWGGERVMLDGSGYDVVQDYRDLGAPPLTSWGSEDRFLFDRLVQWIDEKPGQPFLAYCWTDQTHNPYARRPGLPKIDFFHDAPPPNHAEALARYLNVLHDTDELLGRLFAALRERGLADDTLVVVTGDHGEAFADPHDQQGHGFTVFQEEINVPFMIWNPRLFPHGERRSEVGGHIDMNPTIADLLGKSISDDWQGHSLFQPDRPDRAYFVASVDDYCFGVREGDWKYIYQAGSRSEALFKLGEDPQELHNLATANPQRTHDLREHVAAFASFEDRYLSSPGKAVAAETPSR